MTRNLPGDDPRFTRRYLTPAKDFLVREKIRDEDAGRLAMNTAHKWVSVYPDYKVSAFQVGDEEGWQYVYYLKSRSAQNAYNRLFSNVLSEELPTIRQNFVFLRDGTGAWTPAEEDPDTELPPDFGLYTWTLTEEFETETDEIVRGLFVGVQRVWRDLTKTLVSKTVDPEMGDVRTSTRTMVAASTSAVAVNASGSVTEVQPINNRFAWQTTRALAGMPALAAGLGVYEDSKDYEMNWSWPAVLSHIIVNPVLADPGDSSSAVVGYNVVPIYLSDGYQGKCQVTETRRWTKKKPIRTGDSGWHYGAAWATSTVYTAGQFRTQSDESYICLIGHTSGDFATDLAAGKWRVSHPLLRSADQLQERSITYIGVELGRIQIQPCLHGYVALWDSQTLGVYPATSPRFWPETILADVKLDRYPGGGWMTVEYEIDAPDDDGIAGDIELSVPTLGATTAVVEWTGETTGSVTATYLDVSTDPDFVIGFLSGFNGKVVTPGSLGTPQQSTITGMTRGQPYYARIRRGALTSNLERILPLPQAEISLSSSGALADGGTLAFGDAAQGSTNVTKTITITNAGLLNLDGFSVALSGTNSGDWTVGTLPTSVERDGGTGTFVVTCTPTATGSRTAVLTLTSNAPSNPSYVVNLTCTGVNPEINVKYATVSYASGDAVPLTGTTYGGSYTDYTLTIENTGTGNLTVTAGIVSPDSSMTIQTAPITPVAGSSSTTMIVRFEPTVDGGSASTLTLTNNDLNETSYVLNLQAVAICTGTIEVTNPLGVVAASGGTYEFGTLDYASGGATGVREKSFVIENAGVGTLNTITAALSGADAAEFSIATDYDNSLEAGITTSVNVTFDAGLPAGDKTAVLTITSSDPTTPSYTVTLTGVSVAAVAPEIQVECPAGTVLVDAGSTLDFGPVLTSGGTGTKTVRISNPGCDTLTSLAAANSGGNTSDFTYGSVTASMAYDTSQDVVATFNPSAYGPRSTELRIASNDATENPFNITMVGVGVPANALLTGQSAGVFIGQANATAQATTVDASTVENPFQGAVSSTGRLAVAVKAQNRVLIWNTVPTTSGVPADLVLGQANMTSSSAGTTSTTLDSPRGVYWHGSALWVIDRGNNRVLRFTNPVSNGQAADLVIGQANFTSNAAATTATGLSGPIGICIYGGKLFVADTSNHRVLVYNAVPTSNGAAANFALGQAAGGGNLTTNASACTADGMNNPYAIAVTLTGKLVVVDRSNNRVLVYTGIPSTGGASASFALGQVAGGGNLTSNAAACTAGGMTTPTAVAVSATGQLAVADGSNSRALVWYDTPTSVVDAHAVLGQTDFTTGSEWAGGSVGAAVMSYPTGLCWNGTSLLVSGEQMHRVMKFSPA